MTDQRSAQASGTAGIEAGLEAQLETQLETQVAAWRTHLRNRRTIAAADADELEDHLREQVEALRDTGLSADEAFLVAVKRMGAIDEVTREFAREHSERLWKQLVLSGDGRGGAGGRADRRPARDLRPWVALGLAVAAAIAVKLPALAGLDTMGDAGFYVRNLSFFTLPLIAAYFAWDRGLDSRTRAWLSGPFVIAAVVVNAFPFASDAGHAPDTMLLSAAHLPIALWLVVGVAYAGGRWRGSERRMDFVRFTGELAIYYTLIALGGAVLLVLTSRLFLAIGIDAERFLEDWVLPAGIVGAAVIATWLVEAKQSVIENMAPVLTRIFSPLFVLALAAFLVAVLVTGRGVSPDRDVLIAFDLLLMVVFGLLLYAISAREPLARPGLDDWVSLVLVVAALLVDALALAAIAGRIAEYGVSPNKLVALGMNLVLLVNLAGSAVLYARFLRRGTPFGRLLAWQSAYLAVIAGWAAVVAFLVPPLFGFR